MTKPILKTLSALAFVAAIVGSSDAMAFGEEPYWPGIGREPAIESELLALELAAAQLVRTLPGLCSAKGLHVSALVPRRVAHPRIRPPSAPSDVRS